MTAPTKPNFIAFAPIAGPSRISFLGTSFPVVKKALEEVFGGFPIRLSKKDMNILAGMCAAADEGRQPYEDLCQALDKHGDLELTLEA